MSTWRIVGYYLALLVMIVPRRAQAADADDFVTATVPSRRACWNSGPPRPMPGGCRCAAGAESGNPGG